MRSMTHLITGAIAVTTLLAGTTVAASAQSTTIKDKRADVVQYDGRSDQSGTVLDRDASIATGFDATSAKVKYGKKTLLVTMRFADLGTESVQVYGSIRVKGQKSWPSYQIISTGSDKRISVYNRDYSKFLCTGKMTRKNGAKGYISYRIANSCFKKPKSIKVQMGLYAFIGDPSHEDVTIYDESISSTRVKTTTNTKWLKRG